MKNNPSPKDIERYGEYLQELKSIDTKVSAKVNLALEQFTSFKESQLSSEHINKEMPEFEKTLSKLDEQLRQLLTYEKTNQRNDLKKVFSISKKLKEALEHTESYTSLEKRMAKTMKNIYKKDRDFARNFYTYLLTQIICDGRKRAHWDKIFKLIQLQTKINLFVLHSYQEYSKVKIDREADNYNSLILRLKDYRNRGKEYPVSKAILRHIKNLESNDS